MTASILVLWLSSGWCLGGLQRPGQGLDQGSGQGPDQGVAGGCSGGAQAGAQGGSHLQHLNALCAMQTLK